MTINDIAKECGVSITTVSRALNNSGYVKAETRAKILKTVEKYDFMLNRNARELRAEDKSVIAIIVSDGANSFLLNILNHLKTLIQSTPYDTNIVILKETEDEAAAAWDILRQTKPLGFIFLSLNIGNLKNVFWEAGVPCVIITSKIARPMKNIAWVSTDDFGAALSMTLYLTGKGHRAIGMIGGGDSFPAAQRYEGFVKGIERSGLSFDPGRMYCEADYSYEGGYRATKELLKKCPALTAVFCISDVMAIGACRALRDAGLAVPDDISVTGFDAIPSAEFYCPRITTIGQSTERLAEEGLKALKALVDKRDYPRGITVPYEFIEGESVKSLI